MEMETLENEGWIKSYPALWLTRDINKSKIFNVGNNKHPPGIWISTFRDKF